MNVEEITELKNKLQAAIFSIDDGIAMVDFKGKVLVLNDSARRFLGIKKGYPYDRHFLEYIEDSSVREKIRALLTAKERSETIEIAIPNERQKEIHVKVMKNLVTTAKKEKIGNVIAIHDITMEKKLETMKDDFVHSITHDLKSPLTSVQGFLRLFIDGELGPIGKDQKHYMGIMMHSTDKLLRMINNILDMARFEAHQLTISKSEWDIVGAAKQLVESLQGIARHQEIKMSCEVVRKNGKKRSEAIEKLVIHADGPLLERVIANLLDNALKFTPAEGHVELKVIEHPDQVEVSIHDTGRGIPPEMMEKIFHKFQQAPGTKGGTGLGLTIAKHIIEAHGGKINVISQAGQGSTFHFWLPKNTKALFQNAQP